MMLEFYIRVEGDAVHISSSGATDRELDAILAFLLVAKRFMPPKDKYSNFYWGA